MVSRRREIKYIEDDSKRRTTCKKRRASVIKKVNELSTLCGIEACAVIYDPNESQPLVWPSHSGVQSVITKFKDMPEIERRRYMSNQTSFLAQSYKKAKDQLKRVRDENKRVEMELCMFHCLKNGCIDANIAHMVDPDYLLSMINQNLKDIEWKQRQLGTVVAASEEEQPLKEVVENVDGLVHGMEQTNISDVQMQDLSSDSTNDAGNMVLLPLGDNNSSNDFWPSPSLP